MRIVWQGVSPWCSTGYGIQTRYAVRILKKLGHKVIISAFAGLVGSPITYEGVKVFPSENWGATQTPAYCKEFNADILISLQDLWPLPQNYGLQVDHWHPWVPIDHEPPPPKVLDRLKFSRKPIAMSLNGQRQLKELGIDSYYIPHGVDCKVFRPGNKLDNLGDNFVVGMVAANRGPRKNIQQAIQAFSKFHSRHKDSVMYIHSNVADTGAGINLRNVAEGLKLTGSVFFPKQLDYYIGLSEEELAEVYNSFDVFLNPAAGEGFGIPIIEAQACGIPVIVSNFTSMPELVGGGWLLKKLQKIWTYQDSWQVLPDIDEIVECLEQAYQMKKDGSIISLKRKARKKALEYDWDKLTLVWDDVLKDIESKPKGRNLEGIQPQRLMLIPKEIEPKRVLDIGCGVTMPYKPYLEKLGEYVGVDIKGGDGVVKADACHLPFNNQEFGLAWMMETLEHIATPQLAVNEARRVAKHGVIMFSTPVNPNFKLDDSHKEVRLNEEYMVNREGNGIVIW